MNTAPRHADTQERVPREVQIELLRVMLLIRRFEQRVVDEYGVQEMKTPVHLCIGQEAIAAGVCAALTPGDYLFSNHRGHGHCLARGVAPRALFAEFYGKETGCSHGAGGSMHPTAPQHGILGTSAIVAGGVPHAVGTALATRVRADGRVSVTFFGDGAADQGIVYECLSFAALKRLPVIFVCENNLYATNSHLSARQPREDIHRRGEPFGVPGVSLDGNDVLAVYRAASDAVARARSGDGPTLLECKTYRWKGHVGPEADFSRGFRPEAELRDWMERCPVRRHQEHVVAAGMLSPAALAAMIDEITQQLEDALTYGKESPLPSAANLTQHVYKAGG